MSAPLLRKRIDAREQQAGNFKISSAEREVRRAIEELRDSEKFAYLQALEKAPDRVASESRVDRFLRREKSDVAAAAKLQAQYWTDRLALFGDRAFLPLDDLTGNGALTSEDIEAMGHGFIVRTPDDIAGRPSLLIDESTVSNTPVSGIVHLRCLFYWLSIHVAQNPKAQTEGVNMIRCISDTSFDRDINMKMVKLVGTCLPVKVYSSHVVLLPPPGARQAFTETLLPVLAELTSELKATKNKIHTSEDRQEILRELEREGLPQGALPPALGGSWTYDTFKTWFDRQRKGTSLERGSAPATVSSDGDTEISSIGDSLVEASKAARAEERKERKRQLDVIYARKRREREKDDTEDLQDQCYQLNQSNMVLKEEGDKLERLLGEAQRMAEVLEATQVAPSASSQTPAVANHASSGAAQMDTTSDLERQLIQQLLAHQQSQAVAANPNPEVLLQLLALSSWNSNSSNNLISAVQQVTPALSLLQANWQSQEVLTAILCQVVNLLQNQNSNPPPVSPASSDMAAKLIQILPLIQQLQGQQNQTRQQFHTQPTTPAVHSQPPLQPQSIPMDTSTMQEQLLRLLQNGGQL